MVTQKSKREGRPTLLNDDVQDTIVTAVRLGMYLDDAASMAGISRQTLFRWLAWGRDANEREEGGETLNDRDTLYRDFCDAVEKARADAVMRNVGIIQKAAQDGSWQASAWYLERTNPRKWGRHETVEITGAEGGPIQVETTVKDALRAKFEAAERAALEVLRLEPDAIEAPRIANEA